MLEFRVSRSQLPAHSFGRLGQWLRIAIPLLGLFLAVIGSSPAQGAGAVEVTFWHDWSGEGGKAVAAVVEDFNASQDDVKVKLVETSNLGQKVLTSIAGGIAPDVVLFDRYQTGQFASRGALRALDGYLKESGNTIKATSFFPATWKETQYEGSVYSIPFETNSRLLFYNRSLFDEAGLDENRPPDTWDELVAASMKLTRRDAKGTLSQVGYVPIWDGVSLVHYLWQNGGDVFSPDMKQVTFYKQAGVEALEWVTDFVEKYGMANLVAFQAGFGTGAQNPFYVGKVAMKSEGNWVYGDLRRYAEPFLLEDLRLAFLPKKKERATIAGGFSLVIPASSKHPREAWRFIQYAVSKPAQIEFATRAGVLPALVDAAKDRRILGNKFWAPFVAAMDHAKYRPVHPGFPEIETLIYQTVGEAVNGKQSPRAALETVAARAQGILDRYNKHFSKK